MLKSLDLAAQGPVLDMGCGNGIIGTVVARRHPGTAVHMVDAGEIAVAAAARTAATNHAAVQCYSSDLYGEVPPGVRFGEIVTNPPFHAGVETNYGITSRLIQESPDHLLAGGRLWLVANRFLPYDRLLNYTFGRVATVAQNARFTLYLASE